jgi:hypothetical protein
MAAGHARRLTKGPAAGQFSGILQPRVGFRDEVFKGNVGLVLGQNFGFVRAKQSTSHCQTDNRARQGWTPDENVKIDGNPLYFLLFTVPGFPVAIKEVSSQRVVLSEHLPQRM